MGLIEASFRGSPLGAVYDGVEDCLSRGPEPREHTVSREFVRRIQSGADLPALEQGALSGFEW